MQATKVRRVPRGKGLRVGSPPGSPPAPEAIVLYIFTSLCPASWKWQKCPFYSNLQKRSTFDSHLFPDDQKAKFGEHSRFFPSVPHSFLFPFLISPKCNSELVPSRILPYFICVLASYVRTHSPPSRAAHCLQIFPHVPPSKSSRRELTVVC